MEKEQYLIKFNTYKNKLNALALALATMNYDLNTIAPQKGSPYRNEMMSNLSTQYFETSIDKDYIDTLYQLQQCDIDPIMKREIEVRLRMYEREKNVPVDVMNEFNLLCLNGYDHWHLAKEKSDYSLFEKDLQKLVAMAKQLASYQAKEGSTYDILLDRYEEGLTQEKVDHFFKVIQDRLVPFIDKIVAKNIQKPEFLSRKVPLDKQREITQLVRNYLDFSPEYSYISESPHPFSSTFSINDTRITTKYVEDDFTSNIFSIIHEIGHGTFNHQVNPEYEGLAIADAMSMSLHESQSRFLENNIGRSKAFWTYLYPQLQAIIPEQLSDISLDEFIFGINYSHPSLIRTDADELTYPLHILIRYNMEQKMLNENVTTNLNTIWADEYEKILKVRPTCDACGILQDVHWSDASFGYFPTYALGSAYACQFYLAMAKDLDIEKELEQGNFLAIKKWLKENIHQYAAFYPTSEILKKVTQSDFDPNIYCDYLIKKYSALYQLD